jgi:ectoine hydroxylase-related dioxygenase (phytanoyl-CoA dioxygenase family)
MCLDLAARVSAAVERSTSQGRLQAKVAEQSVTYGSRNLLSLFPEVVNLLALPVIAQACASILGASYGVVRGLYFDKPPGLSWSLPWHQDLTIAVKEHQPTQPESTQESMDGFSKPTVKAGVCHVEAPTWLLENMLTVRIHIDAMCDHNGPVLVQRGSHRAGKLTHHLEPCLSEITEIHCSVGSVMLMRPLLSHSSIASKPDSNMHRRIVHLELSSFEILPNGYSWQSFVPVARSGV